MRRVLVLLVAGTLVSGLAAAYASAGKRVAPPAQSTSEASPQR